MSLFEQSLLTCFRDTPIQRHLLLAQQLLDEISTHSILLRIPYLVQNHPGNFHFDLGFTEEIGKILHELDPQAFPPPTYIDSDTDEIILHPTYYLQFDRWSHPYIYEILQLTGDTFLVPHLELRIEKFEFPIDTRIYTRYGNFYNKYSPLSPKEIYEKYYKYPATKSSEEIREVMKNYIDLDKIDTARVKEVLEKADQTMTVRRL